MASNETHPLATAALVGGGALLVWLLLRGKKWGLGPNGSGSGPGTPAIGATQQTADPPRCQVFIRSTGIHLDGVLADLPTVVARCRAVGKADLQVTGGARLGDMLDVFLALQAVGVEIAASPKDWDAFHAFAPGRSSTTSSAKKGTP